MFIRSDQLKRKKYGSIILKTEPNSNTPSLSLSFAPTPPCRTHHQFGNCADDGASSAIHNYNVIVMVSSVNQLFAYRKIDQFEMRNMERGNEFNSM